MGGACGTCGGKEKGIQGLLGKSEGKRALRPGLINSFSILSDDRSKTSSKTIPSYSAI